jgi:hypothetical protein
VAEVHVHGRGEQRQPAAGDQQPAPLGQRGPPVQQPHHVPGPAPHHGQQLRRRRPDVPPGQVGDREVDGVQHAPADVGGLRPAVQLEQLDVQVVGAVADRCGDRLAEQHDRRHVVRPGEQLAVQLARPVRPGLPPAHRAHQVLQIRQALAAPGRLRPQPPGQLAAAPLPGRPQLDQAAGIPG